MAYGGDTDDSVTTVTTAVVAETTTTAAPPTTDEPEDEADHDHTLATDRVFVINAGRVVDRGKPVQLLAPELIAAVFGVDGRCGTPDQPPCRGGQRQRLAIARALLRDTPVVVFDEAVANLDTESEAAIRKGLAAIGADRTTIVIALRLSTIRRADRVVMLDVIVVPYI